jgi:hypothetical protein
MKGQSEPRWVRRSNFKKSVFSFIQYAINLYYVLITIPKIDYSSTTKQLHHQEVNIHCGQGLFTPEVRISTLVRAGYWRLRALLLLPPLDTSGKGLTPAIACSYRVHTHQVRKGWREASAAGKAGERLLLLGKGLCDPSS